MMTRWFAAGAVTAMAACASGGGQAMRPSPSAAPSTPASAEAATQPAAAAVSHPRWRPRHQGGAYLSTGLYLRDDDDLVVNTPMPIVMRRTYNSGDAHQRLFGLDWMHSGEWWIRGDSDPRVPWGDLIMPTGRIHFVRISPGDTQEGAVLRHDSTPSEFYGALLSWNGSLWEMRLRDGSVAMFLDCQADPDVCWLVERRDPDGHRVAYVRDRSGTLLRMESEGQSIAFDYDDPKRIVRAYDTSGNEVHYTYDGRGRLIAARYSDGTLRTYAYDDRDKLVEIREPGRIVRNWFDDAGRWVRQVVKDSDDDPDPYVATARYVVEHDSIVESDFDEGRGLRVTRYNAQHYIVGETVGADGSAPIVFTYDRDTTSNQLTGATMTCRGPAGPATRPIPSEAANDDAMKARLAVESCRPW